MNATRALLRAAPGCYQVRLSGRSTPRLRVSAPQATPVRFRALSTSRAFLAESPLQGTQEFLGAKKAAKRGAVALKVAKLGGFLIGSTCLGLLTFVGVVFIHDAFTYTTKHVDRVPVSPLALNPELGGPKNLPVARVLIDDDEVRAVFACYPRTLFLMCNFLIKRMNQTRLSHANPGWLSLEEGGA